MEIIDFRSDTVTKPTKEMRQAMYDAEVGDDSRRDDPTTIKLEALAAEITGKEEGLLMASGSMGNLVSVLVNANRGDEIIQGHLSHMYTTESGAASSIGSVQTKVIQNGPRGEFQPEDVKNAIQGTAYFLPRTKLLSIENTHNNCGGTVQTKDEMTNAINIMHNAGIKVHLDGARIFNAAVYLKTTTKDLCTDIDDLTFCLSKGLSAPIGSVLCGTHEFIEEARRARQSLGGALRQSGIISAAGIIALTTMIDRLEDDHENAKYLATLLSNISHISVNHNKVQTNMVYCAFDNNIFENTEIKSLLDNIGIKNIGSNDNLRFVTHRHITKKHIEIAANRINKMIKEQISSFRK